MVSVHFQGGVFYCKASFEEREIPRKARFLFLDGRWATRSHGIAARLREYADQETKNEIDRLMLRHDPWTGRLPYPPTLEPLAFQPDGARFALERNRSFLAADPGLGKTIMAALVTNALFEKSASNSVLYICPPFLTRNTEEEFKKWRAAKYSIKRFTHHVDLLNPSGVLIMPDSMIARAEVLEELKEYIRLARKEKRALTLIVDEAHRYKNDDTNRSKAVFGVWEKEGDRGIAGLFDKVVYMSGTPMRNGRPMELYRVLSHSAPETIDFMNRFDFGMKYCAGFQEKFGWNFKGASNVPELVKRMRERFMLRLRKELLDLPPKLEEIVILEDDLPPALVAMERRVLDHHSPEDLLEDKIRRELEKDELHLATYRRMLGLAKIPSAAVFIKDLLDEGDESFLVFAHHKEVINELASALKKYGPLVITGDTPMRTRHNIVSTFQTSKLHRIFIGQIQAAGEGITLTKATRVVILEPSWVGGENDQASDRAHRHGQKGSVLVQYLCYRNSLDKAVLETIFRKRKTTNVV